MRRGPGAALAMAAALVVACSSEPSPDASPPRVVAQDKGFVLVMAVPTDHFAEGQAIDVRTSLTWTGPAPTATIWASGMGPVGFVYEELTGRHRSLGGVMTADCAQHLYDRGVVTSIPLNKNVGWSEDDPDTAFLREFARDPQLRLPAGRWRITAQVDGLLAPCDADAPALKLQAVLEIGVG
jgi:hypothetical protein